MQSKYIWLNGKLVNYADANLHFLTPGLHYGVAAFEGIRCYRTPRGPAIFRLREHIERLVGSCKVLGWKQLPFDAAQLIEACRLTVQANVSSFTRHQPNVMMTKAKIAGNYPNSVLAKTESMRLGFDEAIMLDCQGMVAECTGENIFVVINGRMVTPPEGNILAGITRDSLIQLAADHGYEVVTQPISRDQLYTADEVFVSGTAAEVIGLRESDFRVIGSGKTGPITRALQEAYRAAVCGNHPRSAGWLTRVEGDGRAGRGHEDLRVAV